MVSIIIPVYNQADKIAACFDSILGQSVLETPAGLEVITVNDGSKDGIAAVIDGYAPLFGAAGIAFKFISQENRGANAARNRGAAEAGGEYAIFCDADIVMERDMLADMLDALRDNPRASYAYSSFMWGRKIFRLWPYSAEKLREMPYIHTTSLIRREHFPGFDGRIKRLQDWDLWLTMLEEGHTGIWIDRVLFKVKTGGTMSDWLPSSAYKLLPFLPAVKKYEEAMRTVKNKHKLL